MEKKETFRVSTLIAKNVADQLRLQAVLGYRTMSEIVEEALRDYFNQHGWIKEPKKED